MIERLEELDRNIVVAVNGLHSPLLDELMWYTSKIPVWFPLYLLLFVLVYKKYKLTNFLWYLGAFALLILLCDQISSTLFKPLVGRWRPSHNLLLQGKLHFYEMRPGEFYKGGRYSFISGHATNSFGIAVLSALVLKPYFKNIMIYMLLWAILVSFSRIYLGVHYLTDILAGALVGTLVAYLIYRFFFLRVIKPLEASVK